MRHLARLPRLVGLLFVCAITVGVAQAQTSSLIKLMDDYAATPTLLDLRPVTDSVASTGLQRFLTPAAQYDPKRFWTGIGITSGLYAGVSVGLWEAWYKDYEIGGLRSIDDRREWEHMDKVGHIYTAYLYSRWSHQGLRWAGASRPKAVVMSAGVSILLQSTVEVMDGFSKAWGFSWADMASNLAGTGFFTAQELLWQEQRIHLKISSSRQSYSSTPIPATSGDGPSSSLANRAVELYGDTPWQRFIKDYNAQTLWLSTNPTILVGAKKPILPWLNLAVGISGKEIYGAYGSVWREGPYVYDGRPYANRGNDYILSLDVNFERIPVKSPVLKTVFFLLNSLKFPAPAVILGGGNSPEYRWMYF